MSVTVNGQAKPPASSGKERKPKERSAAADRGPVAAPPKLRRRPLLVVLSVVAVCLGALLAVWAYTSTTTAQEVVAVRSSVERGQVIDREDLVTVRIGVDPALQPIPAAELESIGRAAGGDGSARPAGWSPARRIAPAVLPAQGHVGGRGGVAGVVVAGGAVAVG